MDDINNWRVKIGTFGCHRSWRAQHVKFICIEFRMLKFCLCLPFAILEILLIIGNVESNPGPGSKQTRPNSAGGINKTENASEDSVDLRNILDQLNSKLDIMAKDIKEIKRDMKGVMDDINELKTEVDDLSKRCMKVEDEKRRKNLIISGIPKSDKHDVLSFKDWIVENLNLTRGFVDGILIDRAVRFPLTKFQKGQDKHPDLLVSFCSLDEKLVVYTAARKIKPENVYFKEDFSKNVREIRKNLSAVMLNARKNKDAKAYLNFDKLVIEKNGKRNTYTFNLEKKEIQTIKTNFKYSLQRESEDDTSDHSEVE